MRNSIMISNEDDPNHHNPSKIFYKIAKHHLNLSQIRETNCLTMLLPLLLHLPSSFSLGEVEEVEAEGPPPPYSSKLPHYVFCIWFYKPGDSLTADTWLGSQLVFLAWCVYHAHPLWVNFQAFCSVFQAKFQKIDFIELPVLKTPQEKKDTQACM